MAANDVPCCETMFWVYLVISTALVSFAGLMSGLTLGLMSLSLVDLEVLIKAGQPNDQKNAAKILPIVKNQHLLLCTLLICNSLAMEALPIFLDALLPAWGAILISVTLILAFGELLDLLLGKGHSALLRRAELKTLVDLCTLELKPTSLVSFWVLETIPLYDLLNQFQKGHSHMAVVVKNKDSTADAKAKMEMFRTKMNSYSPEMQTFQKGADEAFPNEEVIGIITMEDVLEQLLQEPIFDETDGYVEVHNKIKINMLPGMNFFSRSPRVGSPSSKSNWRSPVASPSPLSPAHQTPISYHHTPLLHSPVSAYTSPCATARPNLYASPGNFAVNSPHRYARSVHNSPVPLSHSALES